MILADLARQTHAWLNRLPLEVRLMQWTCFLCLNVKTGKPCCERQALPSGIMLRACGDCCSQSPSAEQIAECATKFVESGGRRR